MNPCFNHPIRSIIVYLLVYQTNPHNIGKIGSAVVYITSKVVLHSVIWAIRDKTMASSKQTEIFTDRVLSPSELRAHFSEHPCCNNNCCMTQLCMPIDPLAQRLANGVGPLQVIDRNGLSNDISTGSKEVDNDYGSRLKTFEKMVTLVRLQTADFRTAQAKKGALTDFLVKRFREKRLSTGKWVYDIIHPNHGLKVVCQTAWLGVFGVTMNELKYVQEKVRSGLTNAFDSVKNEPITKKAAFAAFGMDVDNYHRYLTALIDFNGIAADKPRHYIAAAYLCNWIDSCADWNPDSEQLHLDKCTFKSIHEQYESSNTVQKLMEDHGKVLSYNEFRTLLNEAFPKVYIRDRKGIPGKCHLCEGFANLAKTCHLPSDLMLIRNYRMYHRNFFMGEKIAYTTVK